MVLWHKPHWKTIVTFFCVDRLYLNFGALVNVPGFTTDGGELTIPQGYRAAG